MFNPFYYFTACFKKPSKIEMEQCPTEKHGSSPIIFSSSGKGRPLSNRRKMSSNSNGGSFKVEINLTRILSLKRKNFSQTEPPNTSRSNNTNKMDDIHYKKMVAKRWRQRRDHAIYNGKLFYGHDNSFDDLTPFYHFTDNVPNLYSSGYKELPQEPSSTCLNTGIILKKDQQVYLSRDAFKNFFKNRFGITPFRSPCEAYVILPKNDNDLTIVKILEKKAQTHSDGSFETKIWSSISIKKEYEITLGEKFCVEYAICLNSVLEVQYKNLNVRKINIIQALLRENHVPMFFGEQPDYLKQLNGWTQFC